MTIRNDIQTYVLLARTRSARGHSLEMQLGACVQAHAQQMQREQEARKQYEESGLKLSAHVQHVRDLLSSREVMHMDAILNLRTHREFLDEAKKSAHLQCVHVAKEVTECLQCCLDMRRRIAINDERVHALRAQIRTLQEKDALVIEDAEEEEQQEAHAARHASQRKQVLL
jgi:hypothetical protein